MSQNPLDYETPKPTGPPDPSGVGFRLVALAIIFLAGAVVMTATDGRQIGALIMVVSGLLFVLNYTADIRRKR